MNEVAGDPMILRVRQGLIWAGQKTSFLSCTAVL